MNHKSAIRLAFAALLVAAAIGALAYRGDFDAAAVEAWVRRYGIWAPVIFVGLYLIATVLFLPGSVLTIVGGMLFGPLLGTFYSLTGATAGATVAFLIARYLASGWVARKAGGRLKRLIEGVEAEGWRFVAFTRLVPLFPFNLLNYALGLTRIPLSHYVITSLICMLPGGLAYAYLGDAGREAAAGSDRAIKAGLIALALFAVVAFLPRLIRQVRNRPR